MKGRRKRTGRKKEDASKSRCCRVVFEASSDWGSFRHRGFYLAKRYIHHRLLRQKPSWVKFFFFSDVKNDVLQPRSCNDQLPKSSFTS